MGGTALALQNSPVRGLPPLPNEGRDKGDSIGAVKFKDTLNAATKLVTGPWKTELAPPLPQLPFGGQEDEDRCISSLLISQTWPEWQEVALT